MYIDIVGKPLIFFALQSIIPTKHKIGSLKLWDVISLESSSEAERNTVNVEVEISKFSSPANRLTNSVNFRIVVVFIIDK